VETALLKDWLPERLAKAKADGALLAAEDVAEALIFMLSRPKGVTVRDVIILPSSFDI
jgi:ribitol 2-dehydrogenase